MGLHRLGLVILDIGYLYPIPLLSNLQDLSRDFYLVPRSIPEGLGQLPGPTLDVVFICHKVDESAEGMIGGDLVRGHQGSGQGNRVPQCLKIGGACADEL